MPWSCRFCSKTFSGVRLRSIDNVIEEIRELMQKYNIRGVAFNDELVLINKQRAHELCDKIGPLHIKWSCQGRVNNVDLDLLKRMKQAGCVAVGYGIESGSQTILNAMNKKATVEQARNALRDTVKAGMIPIVQMMYGYPGETRETLLETIDFFKSTPFLGADVVNSIILSATVPLPGAELYEQTVKDGRIDDEEKFLGVLSDGYMQDVENLLVNFTDFNEDEFWRLKKDTEQKIKEAQIRRYFLKYIINIIMLRMGQFASYYKRAGLKKTLKAILLKLTRTRNAVSHEEMR